MQYSKALHKITSILLIILNIILKSTYSIIISLFPVISNKIHWKSCCIAGELSRSLQAIL